MGTLLSMLYFWKFSLFKKNIILKTENICLALSNYYHRKTDI